jgi:hypothetical protein
VKLLFVVGGLRRRERRADGERGEWDPGKAAEDEFTRD